MGHYILDGQKPVKCDDLFRWAEFMGHANRTVDFTRIGKSEVSTVFLGADHNFSLRGDPILFETMVFGGSFDGDGQRASTWEQAEEIHRQMVKRVEDAEGITAISKETP